MGSRLALDHEVMSRTLLRPQESSAVHAQTDGFQFLRLHDVKAITGLAKSTVYEMIRDKSFPAPVKLGPRSVGWVRDEIKQWAADRVFFSRLPTTRNRKPPRKSFSQD
jgi:prophage regulatory protein